jgi:hypothetical protein
LIRSSHAHGCRLTTRLTVNPSHRLRSRTLCILHPTVIHQAGPPPTILIQAMSFPQSRPQLSLDTFKSHDNLVDPNVTAFASKAQRESFFFDTSVSLFSQIMTDSQALTSCRRSKRAISMMKMMVTSPHGQHIPLLPSYRHQTTAHGGKRSASPYTVLCVKTRSSRAHPSHQILPDSIACRLYVITVLVETTIDLVIEGDLLLRFHKADNVSSESGDITSQKMPVFLSIFALAQYVRPRCPSYFSANTVSPASSNWLWH